MRDSKFFRGSVHYCLNELHGRRAEIVVREVADARVFGVVLAHVLRSDLQNPRMERQMAYCWGQPNAANLIQGSGCMLVSGFAVSFSEAVEPKRILASAVSFYKNGGEPYSAQ